MVPHLGGGLCREKIAARCIEEREDCTVFKGWGIRDIHDDLCIGKRPIEALARDRVDDRAGRGLQNVVTLLVDPARELRADRGSPPHDVNLHCLPSLYTPPVGPALDL